MKNDSNIIPILLGSDLNAYSVARAFHEYTGEISHAFGRYKCGLTSFSHIVKAHTVAGLDDIQKAGAALFDFAKLHKGKRLLIIPCADWYIDVARSVSTHMPESYVALLPTEEHRALFGNKRSFYKILDKYGIKYPKTEVIFNNEDLEETIKAFEYPAVIKPADSALYWKYSFPGMRKVYFAENEKEAEKVCKRIFNSGYNKELILQKKIGNDANNVSVYTTYSDRNGNVVRGVYGRVILEECGKTSYGNHSAIITEPRSEICEKLTEMLDEEKYMGFANFDIISDGKDEYVLEMNIRQGRSCDYLRAAGVNIAELMLKDLNGEKIKKSFEYGNVYWHYPPHSLVLKEGTASCAAESERLRSQGKSYSPLNYVKDFLTNPLRRAYVYYHNLRLRKHFEKKEMG